MVVSVNHRLNVFGYAWFGDLVPELADHANPGQRDIDLALRWVRENVAAFGGDPGTITVMGESGGGAKSGVLAATPSEAGLFDRMIVQSGSQTVVHDRQRATDIAHELLRECGIYEPDVAVLTGVYAGRWKAAAVEKKFGLLVFQPVAGVGHLPGQPWSTEVTRGVADIPLPIGRTTDETVAFLPAVATEEIDEATLHEQLNSFFGTRRIDAEQLGRLVRDYRAAFPDAGRSELLLAITNDVWMLRSTRQVLELRTGVTPGSANFCFEFAWPTPCFGSSWSPHAGEIPYLFGNLEYPTAWDGEDDAELRVKTTPTGSASG